MNKKINSLILSGLIVITLTGCDANLTFNGKEIINFSTDKKIEQRTEDNNIYEQKNTEREYTDEQVIAAVKTGEYTLSLNESGEEYIFKIEKLINCLYSNPLYIVSYKGNGIYKVIVSDDGTGDYITFDVSETSLNVCQICIDNVIYNNDNAKEELLNIVYELFINGNLSDIY